MSQRLTMKDYDSWKPEQQAAWRRLGQFVRRLVCEGKLARKAA